MLTDLKNARRDIFLITSTQIKKPMMPSVINNHVIDGNSTKIKIGTAATALILKKRAECAALLQ
ncbi:hypothetical protein [Massilia sp. MP_M2]|uniref:hypothetical protein n=1 Tax=Massilia sp. MP_M2 TaxID=3071713 RepID=UPI00319DA860